MLKQFVCLAILASGSYAQGGLGDTLLDIVTFGESSRQRDKERARSAEREAQSLRNSAEKEWESSELKRKTSIAKAHSDITIQENHIQLLETVRDLIKSHGEIIDTIASDFIATQDSFSTLKKIIAIQQEDLLSATELQVEQQSSDVEQLENELKFKIKKHQMQINRFPDNGSNENAESLIGEILTSYELIVIDVDETIVASEGLILQLKDQITALEVPTPLPAHRQIQKPTRFNSQYSGRNSNSYFKYHER